MSDNFENKNYYSDDSSVSETEKTESEELVTENKDNNIYSQTNVEEPSESSYEWNTPQSDSKGAKYEYHYSYVNGRNVNAAHNPNNYENSYSSYSSGQSTSSDAHSYSQPAGNSGSAYAADASTQTGYNGYSGTNPYSSNNAQGYYYQEYKQPETQKPKKPKKQRKPASKGFVAALLIIGIIASSSIGFCGGYILSRLDSGSGTGLKINKVEADNASASVQSNSEKATEIVKKTADSVVEIATESVVRGGFAQQYVQKGAGSGVIISEDGYIITNNHVIEGAQNITVTLRDGTKSYTAALIGSDEENDIALIKVDANGLSPATFGDSSSIAVGDYVLAIGNPLGELGGTVTDGIVSALAREVEVDGKSMTLLQHNAQISPGNSGGGLFNAKGELIGIVNAKDSATEVEGIAFAIPVNTVIDIIEDLQNYGYVTGKVDLGMELTDITSQDTAFFYGVNQTGCYILKVEKGSNAAKAGFRTGDLITKLNGTDVNTSEDIKNILKDAKVGDIVDFTIYRSGKTSNIKLELEEYVPSSANNYKDNEQQNNSGNNIWNEIFG